MNGPEHEPDCRCLDCIMAEYDRSWAEFLNDSPPPRSGPGGVC